MGLTAAEAKTTFLGHQVAATYNGVFGMNFKGFKAEWKLYIDGKIEDTSSLLYFVPPKQALMRARLDHDGKPHVVEVYATGSINIGLEIVIDGVKCASS